MREIKFRGMDNFGEWHYGDYQGPCTSFFETYIYGRETFYFGNEKHSPEGLYEVIPETIGQYTGLKDRNGVEIYEGDVVKFRWGGFCTAYVIYQEGAFEVKNDKQDVLLFLSVVSNICQVIGNTYENPELITQKEGKV